RWDARGDGGSRGDAHERASRQRSSAFARVVHLMYFQFLDFPSAIHSIACARRLLRVSSVLASVSHSRYSRLWLGGKAAYADAAFLFFFSAAVRNAGVRIGFLGVGDLRSSFVPASLSSFAFFR